MAEKKLIRTRPEFNIEEAEKIINKAPIINVQEKKETKKGEPLQQYILIYPRQIHNRVKMAAAKTDKRNLKDWLIEAIEEKLIKDDV